VRLPAARTMVMTHAPSARQAPDGSPMRRTTQIIRVLGRASGAERLRLDQSRRSSELRCYISG
jgi:hypothetical protein